jgi:L-fuculose-phosphate aldolase
MVPPRRQMVEAMRCLEALGLNRGTSGNLSIRHRSGFLVTPSGLRPADLTAKVMVAVDADGHWGPGARPSSEWRFHHDIYRMRHDVGAVVHVHSPFATALACQRRDIPAFHYMVAVAGGDTIRCARYATFGTQALSDHVVAALADRMACLLANHGMIAVGADLDGALAMAIEVEALAEHYWRTLQGGKPVLLGKAEMARVIAKFRTYGQANGDA